jgi:hypothetical protein
MTTNEIIKSEISPPLHVPVTEMLQHTTRSSKLEIKDAPSVLNDPGLVSPRYANPTNSCRVFQDQETESINIFLRTIFPDKSTSIKLNIRTVYQELKKASNIRPNSLGKDMIAYFPKTENSKRISVAVGFIVSMLMCMQHLKKGDNINIDLMSQCEALDRLNTSDFPQNFDVNLQFFESLIRLINKHKPKALGFSNDKSPHLGWFLGLTIAFNTMS